MVKDILKGHLKELTNSNEELSNKRLSICRKCPLMTMSMIGEICDRNKSIDGTHGCGCRLKAKTRLKDQSCPRLLW